MASHRTRARHCAGAFDAAALCERAVASGGRSVDVLLAVTANARARAGALCSRRMRKNLIALVLGAAVLAALLLLRDRTPPPVPPATSPTADAAAPAALVATAPSATSDWPSR